MKANSWLLSLPAKQQLRWQPCAVTPWGPRPPSLAWCRLNHRAWSSCAPISEGCACWICSSEILCHESAKTGKAPTYLEKTRSISPHAAKATLPAAMNRQQNDIDSYDWGSPDLVMKNAGHWLHRQA